MYYRREFRCICVRHQFSLKFYSLIQKISASHWRIQRRGAGTSHPQGPNSFIFMQFSAKKNAKSQVITPTLEVGIPPQENPGSFTASFTIAVRKGYAHPVYTDLARDKGGRRKEYNLSFRTNLQTARRHQVYDGYTVYGGLLGL